MTTRIEAVNNHIIFQFVEDTTKGRFENSHHLGLIISSLDVNQSSNARWGLVTHKGPDVVDEVVVGEYVLIDEGKWTRFFEVNGEKYWKTDDLQVLCASTQPYTTY